jgi:hypothetical protein
MKLFQPFVGVSLLGAIVGAAVACSSGTNSGGGGSCGSFYDSFVAYEQKCEASSANLFGARDRFVKYCQTELAAPGVTSSYSSALDSCASAVQNASASCGKLDSSSACKSPTGTLTDGTACGTSAQCSSGYCKGSGTSSSSSSDGVTTTSFNCGTCGPKIAIGQPCGSAAGTSCVDGATCVFGGTGATGTCQTKPTPAKAGDPCGMSNQTCDTGLKCDYTMMKCVALGASGASCESSSDCTSPLVCLGVDFTKNTKGTCGNGADVGGPCMANGFETGCKSSLVCDPATKTCAQTKYADPGQPCDDKTTFCSKGSCSVGFDTGSTDGGAAPQGTCPNIIPDGAPCDPTKKDQTCDSFAYCIGGKCQLFDPASCK